jgi:DNA-binding beta-propeller fold protein YncE
MKLLNRSMAVSFATLAIAGASAAPPLLELVSTIPMRGVKGRIDHFSANPKDHRIFVAALGNDTVEVVDTERRQRGSIPGLGEPQGVLYLADSNRLFVANGGADRVDIVDAASLSVLKRIDGLDDADNVRYDAVSRKVFVGYGKGALRIIDPASGESRGDIPLPGHPESFQLEQGGNRAFVNVPSARSVVVVDRVKRETLAKWDLAGASANFPMALDETGRRLFVGTRSPATLLVFDIDSGKIVARLSIGNDTDDVFFDSERKRLYAICGEGRIDVIRQETADRYSLEGSMDTARGARTGLFVPEEHRLYVAAPASGASPARILVYRGP